MLPSEWQYPQKLRHLISLRWRPKTALAQKVYGLGTQERDKQSLFMSRDWDKKQSVPNYRVKVFAG